MHIVQYFGFILLELACNSYGDTSQSVFVCSDCYEQAYTIY